MDRKYIRNFAIIAHIDHGKSTLSNQIMKLTDTFDFRHDEAQLLDDMAVEKAHGVTVKSKTVRNLYHAKDGHDYQLNLIDTPGHVDFTYEVSKSLSASDGVILLVDATEGVKAQTIANYKIAKSQNLPVIPVINKIDSDNAQIDRCENQIYELDDSLLEKTILKISAKSGLNITNLLEAIVTQLPAPVSEGDNQPLKALVFDSQYDMYQGIIAHVRLFNGQVSAQESLTLMAQNTAFQAKEVGTFVPELKKVKTLNAGEIGYIATGIKDPQGLRVGDTITATKHKTQTPIPGYQPITPVVFAGIYPNNSDYQELKLAMEKIILTDSSLQYTEIVSEALGAGFHCGFLGLFHLQIIRERLVQDFNISVITTAPNVNYQVQLKDGSIQNVTNPAKFPDFSEVKSVKEPFEKAQITIPQVYMNKVIDLSNHYRGLLVSLDNSQQLVTLHYEFPIAEIAFNFFGKLKTVTQGYATFDTVLADKRESDVVKLTIDVNYTNVDSLTFVTHRSNSYRMAQDIVHKLKYTIPRRLYPMPVQGYIEGKVVARIDVPPLRKNAATVQQSSISKKQSLLRRQNLNKRKATQDHIELPQKVFDTILDIEQ